jgi:hypothetical protein
MRLYALPTSRGESLRPTPHPLQEPIMSQPNKDQDIIRIDLTDSQKELIKDAIGREGDAIELDVKSLEERITPRKIPGMDW